MPEGRRIFADQTVLDNLRLGAVSRRASASEVRAEAEALIEGSPLLRGKAHQPAGVLSGGEQQALAIARGQMAHPRVLLLDEPSLGLAPQAVEAIFETIVGLADRGATILLVEQLATLALEVADDAWVFERGVIRARGSGAELAASAEVTASYLGARSGPGGHQAPSPTETVRTPGGRTAAASHGLPPGGARV